MGNPQKIWIGLGAAVSLIVGAMLLMKENFAAGFFLILLSIGSVATLFCVDQTGARSNPRLVKWGWGGIFVLVVILTVIVGAITLVKRPPSQAVSLSPAVAVN